MLSRQVQRQFPVLLLFALTVLTGSIVIKQFWPATTDQVSNSGQVIQKAITTLPLYSPNKEEKSRINEAFANLPLSFEANQGQTADRVRFLSRGSGYNLFLTPSETVLELGSGELKTAVLRLQLKDANTAALIEGVDELPARSNYFISPDPDNWRTNVPNYSRVRYREIYPGVDMVYYGNQRRLEYDFIVQPGTDPEMIIISCQGADSLEIDPDGDLVMNLAGEKIRQHKPYIYQESADGKEMIAGGYVLKAKNEIGFHLSEYDTSRPLIIDPVLSYSTYLGGVGSDTGSDIALDSSGNVYLTGGTNSTTFPTLGARQGSNAGGIDAFITKLNAAGNALIYSTYLGGGGDDFGSGIAVDRDGNVFITGDTTSTNFPTASPFQTSNAGRQDAFVAKLSAAGNMLIYSTYLGGAEGDAGFGIALDSAGNAYVTGATSSMNYHVVNPFQNSNGGGFDAFVTKLNGSGSSLLYSTYLGGTLAEFGIGITVDSGGNAVIAGSTLSVNFPTLNPLQPASGGGLPFGDAFVTKLNTSGNGLVFSTYLGGKRSDFGNSIALDQVGNIYVAGGTLSMDFPTANPIQSSFAGGNEIGDAFVAKLNPSGSSFVYSTYLGGDGEDFAAGIAVDSAGNAYITGSAAANFPTSNPLQNQTRFGGGVSDAFVTKIVSAGGRSSYSIFLGGSSEDRGGGIAVDALGVAFVTGVTGSSNLPMATPLQASIAGSNDAFMAKVVDVDSPLPSGDFTLTLNPTVQTITPGSSTSFTVGLQTISGFSQPVNLSAAVNPANSNVTAGFSNNTITPGNTATLTVNTTASTQPGTFTITITGTSGQFVRTQVATVNVNAPPDFSLSFNPATLNVTRKQSGQIVATINRTGGFTGNVTVSAPDTKAIKVKLTPPAQSTTGASTSFNFKIKKKAQKGTQQLTFTARDDTGRVRTGTLTLVIQ
jgi:hypothetical protein